MIKFKNSLLNNIFLITKKEKISFYIITALLIIILYIVFQPKVSSSIFTTKKRILLEQFISKVKAENTINPQAYWQLREFYCPGYNIFDRNSAYSGDIFLTYHCSDFSSSDQLITKKELEQKKQEIKKIKKDIIYQDEQIIIYQDKNKLIIEFILLAEKMTETIGYFDYNDEDSKLVKDKYWHSLAKITLK